MTLSAKQIIHAAALLEGLSRYRQLLQDISREGDEIGLPTIVLSDERQLIVHISKDDFLYLIDKNVKSIQEELTELGVDYE